MVYEFDIAIIGMSGKFPGANNLDEYWYNLQNGIESITFFSNEELKRSGIESSLLNHPHYVKAKPTLDDIELFDAAFFGLNPKEATLMDPQHRLFLEYAYTALESSGYANAQGSVGVYAGSSISKYLFNLYSNPEVIESAGQLLIIGNDKDHLSTRVSYKLNLKGPSYTVQTACSTSLVAVHVACQSLLNSECDLALAGGVSISLPQITGYIYQEDDILSPDGHCRAFDAKAQGTLFGSGVGVVVLKRLEDAIADGDHIHAIIKGSAINNDGSLKVSYAAPSVDGQAEVIVEALANAGVDPHTVTYVETHGTGTSMGDPIEIQALTKAFRASTQKRNFCAIGSVKTNIGHLDRAAGIASLIKTVLALKHKQIPPSLHFEQPNPQIDFANSPFYVNNKLREWKTNGTPRRAGVSSFGIGGTNAHVVLEEAPEEEQRSRGAEEQGRNYQLLLVSAKTDSTLETATANLVNHLQQHPELNLADVAYTLQVGRRVFDHRRVAVCQNLDDAVKVFESTNNQRVLTHFQKPCHRPIVFMFPGQGAQYINMAQELYQSEPKFTEQVNRCAELLKPHIGLDLRHLLYPSIAHSQEAVQQLTQTAIAQPALFVIEYALSQLWMSWGVRPEAMIGHSIGEYVAATLAGVFSVEDALAIVAARGRLMQRLPKGAMLSVQLSEDELQTLLGEELSLAGSNAPSLCVVSGSLEAIDKLQQQLLDQNIDCRRLHTSHAFHSQMMEPIIEPFTKLLQKVKLNPPKIPFISNVSGTWITTVQATDPNYWARHLRQPVRFSAGIAEFLKEPEPILLEVGPGRTLSTFALGHSAPKLVTLTSIRHPQEQQSDVAFLLNTLGRLWLFGVQIDWSSFYASEKRYRLCLPTYPFERQRYWIELQTQADDRRVTQLSLSKKPDIADWFYVPIWKQSITPTLLGLKDSVRQKSCTLVFIDECGLGLQLLKRLEQQGQNVIAVSIGSKFAKLSDHSYILNPQQSQDYDALFNELDMLNKIPELIVHLWNFTQSISTELELEKLEESQYLGFYSLLFLTQALDKQNWTNELEIAVISNHIHLVMGEEVFYPEKATILGPVKVIPQEYPNISCRSIDITVTKAGNYQQEKVINQLIWELQAKSEDLVVAYRGGNRWVQTFEPVRLDQTKEDTPRLREKGVYLITDGLRGIGLTLAEYIAQTVQAKLILIEHYELSENDDKIKNVQALEKLGAEVLVKNIDLANLEQMQVAIASIIEHFGEINGVIHAAQIISENLHKPIQHISPTACQYQFQPKVHELIILEKVLQDQKLDFCILISSLSSVLGGLGYVAYSAANIFMDAFAYQRNQNNSVPWISINWDSWQLVEPAEKNTDKTTLSELFITPKEGKEIFHRLLSTENITQVVISTGDLQTRLKQWLQLGSLPSKNIQQELKPTSPSYPRPHLGNNYVSPQTDLERILVHIWQETLGIEQVGIYDNFFELGGHSLLAMHLIAKIKKQLRQNIQLSTLLQGATIKHVANILHQEASHQTSSPLVTIQPHGSKPPLFFVHPIGGNVICYHELSLHLGADQPFYGLQSLGLDGECEPYTRIEDMATHYIQAIRDIQPESPYFLGGWSMGGVIAFEMATQLQKQGHQVSMLAMLDSLLSLPSDQLTESKDNHDLKILCNFAIDMNLFTEKQLSTVIHKLRYLQIDEQFNYFLNQAKIANLVPPDFELQQLRCLVKVFKSHSQALQTYAPQIYPNRIIYFQARKNIYGASHNQALDWRKFCLEPIKVINVPGTHRTMLIKPQLQVLAEQLKTCLNQL